MANRNFASGGKIYSMHVMPVFVTTQITIGASGAVSSFIGTMTKSVVRVSAGIYQINMTDNFFAYLTGHASMQSPSSGLSGIVAIEIQNNPSASVSNLAAPSITVKCLSDSDAAADPAAGSVLDVMIICNNSSVKA
jgi:hypothetical protein